MLFARFLVENNLLIASEWSDVSVSLKDCEELGKDEGLDQWAMAARFAHQMLPQVFRPTHPAFEVRFAHEHRQKLEELIESLPTDVFVASDSLGWVYQFWQSKKKDEVNRSEVKIGADELPAVTQLFTEPYMVAFLLDNTLGAWWAARRLSERELTGTPDEMELRRKAAIPGVPLDYLRFVRHGDPSETAESQSAGAAAGGGVKASELRESSTSAGSCAIAADPGHGTRVRKAKPGRWYPAAGSFDRWPEQLSELRILDPCCGSGHFLVAAFSMLVPMRMELEGLSARDAVDAVLRDNLHGLELDARCVEVAAFALALAVWRYPGAEGYRLIPEMNLACSGLAPNATKEQWTALSDQAAAVGGLAPERNLFGVDDTLLSAPLRNSMDTLYELFAQAPVLGSLIDPHALKTDLFQRDFDSIRELFAVVLEQERTSDDQIERAVAARGMTRAAQLLSDRYTLVITNVPYLLRRKQHETLRVFCRRHYPYASNDLATVFLQRCLGLCAAGGTTSLVLPQNWLFLTTYRNLRKKLLESETWHLVARLGAGAFETISGEVVKATLITLSRSHPLGLSSTLAGTSGSAGIMYGLDVSESRIASQKAARLPVEPIHRIHQTQQSKNPDSRIVLVEQTPLPLVGKYADALVGLQTSDDAMFVTAFWEQHIVDTCTWEYMQSTPNKYMNVDGQSWLVKWEQGQGSLLSLPTAYPLKGVRAIGRPGIAIHRMQQLFAYSYGKERFHQNVAVIVPKSKDHFPALWSFCNSCEYKEAVRRIDQTLKVTNATLAKVPFDLEHWTKVANERYPNGPPPPYSDDPTQWIFHGHPCGSVVWDETQKQTVHGPFRTDPTVLHVAVARLLGYQWPAEHDIDMELADEQREWVRRTRTLLEWVDKDGIVCIPSVRGEPPARDRLLGLLHAAFGDDWTDSVLPNLLANVDSTSLDDWLRDRFFDEHCKLFHHRPFIWHIWDGLRRDGFSRAGQLPQACRRTGRRRPPQILESLTYSYLGDWIERQQDGRAAPGSAGRRRPPRRRATN